MPVARHTRGQRSTMLNHIEADKWQTIISIAKMKLEEKRK
jgi:hypothetical protein